MSNHPTAHLVLVNLGTPDAPTPEAVRRFLKEFLSDPAVVDFPRWLWLPILYGMVLRSRPARVAEQYASIWMPEGSPLRVGTQQMVRHVREQAGDRFTVRDAYRYGEPSLDTTMQQLAKDTSGPIVVAPLFPQRTDATTGTAFKMAREAAARAGIAHRVVERLVEPDDPGYVAAMAVRWREALAAAKRPPDHLVVSFHGIPVRYNRNEQGLYVHDCERTTQAFLAAIGWPAERTTLAYQSRFGPERWLTPATSDVLAELPTKGVTSVAVITPGFLTDGLETLEEIGIRGQESFHHAGGDNYIVVPGVESDPAFITSLCSLVSA
ncbi:MAG: ferrochelatase [Gemmatimonadaceae bacterium]